MFCLWNKFILCSKFNLSLKTVISVLLTYLHNQICGDTNQYDFCYQYVKFFRNLNMTMHIDLYNNIYYKHKISYIDWYRRDWLYFNHERYETPEMRRLRRDNCLLYFKGIRHHLLYTWHGIYYKSLDNFVYRIYFKKRRNYIM